MLFKLPARIFRYLRRAARARRSNDTAPYAPLDTTFEDSFPANPSFEDNSPTGASFEDYFLVDANSKDKSPSDTTSKNGPPPRYSTSTIRTEAPPQYSTSSGDTKPSENGAPPCSSTLSYNTFPRSTSSGADTTPFRTATLPQYSTSLCGTIPPRVETSPISSSSSCDTLLPKTKPATHPSPTSLSKSPFKAGIPRDPPSIYSYQLQQFLIEIMAFTFHADTERLCSLLGCESVASDPKTSILTDAQKDELLWLANKVGYLREKSLRNQFNTTAQCDQSVVHASLVRPAETLQLNVEYVLDLINSYADHECEAARWNRTLIAQYTPKSYQSNQDLTDTLVSHADVIACISKNESVRVLLGEAMAAFQEFLGLGEILRRFRYTVPTVRKGFKDLVGDLLQAREVTNG
ncbi:hypothetical protein BDV95DRAFT_603279 [Massariosphaeria phaeospora]|uniref:Uncharacterized protein n=1 Tax=Massariosphaeria phaeospora TaxID=100035 RepID=A0A7C8MEP9_9PLEO|nr:hypothetical protein BDV95DRAFT_603279 [Massariosphaeria phaeospora]